MNIKIGILNVPKHCNKHDLIHFVTAILTNNSSSIVKTLNFNCGLSDVHNLIAFQLKTEVPFNKSKWCTYRSFKNFDVDYFNEDLVSSLSEMHYSVSYNVNEMYETFMGKILSVTNKHAPLRKKKCNPKPVPYMNKSLKQAIYRKRMLYNQYQTHRTSKIWEKFRLQRNLVT